MPTARRWRPEAALVLLAGVLFLGCLGSIELWGKREQRLAAEVLDTVVEGRWLVARIQGRPRLEKPPLPRWTAASLAVISGRCDEWTVRLPGALAALATVGLTYALGRRIGGRPLGLCAAMVLCTTPLFISESRQAGQDGPLALYTTLALYAAYRFLEPTPDGAGSRRGWAIGFHVALGLGFLCKGPMILMVVVATVFPYAMVGRRLGRAVRLMADPWGLSAFLVLALCWPVPVWLADPNAAGVWLTEIGQKTGALPIAHRERSHFLLEWPVLVLPWLVAGLSGIVLPFRRDQVESTTAATDPAAVWFPWFWSIGTLLLLSVWAVAKPNYYAPCLPGWSLLVGTAWLRLDRLALDGGRRARGAMLLQWGVWLAIGAMIPAVPGRWFSDVAPGWFAAATVAVTLAAVAGAWIGRRGGGPLALFPVTAATALVVVIGYGVVAPEENAIRGHRAVARRIDRMVPSHINTLSFFHELDEGLWFYLRGRRLAPVPGSQPRYSDSYDRLAAADSRIPRDGPGRRIPESRKVLSAWLDRPADPGPGRYLLLRDKVYAPLALDLDPVGSVLIQESGSKRNGLVLLRIEDAPEPAAASQIR